MSEENGTLRVLPYSRAGGGKLVAHAEGAHHKTTDLGAEAGLPIIIRAGGMVVMSSNVFHCSRPNRSPAPRRALLAQYIARPITGEDGRRIHFADPFVKDGRRLDAAGRVRE